MSLSTILDEIKAERNYQEEKWGADFDDINNLDDWITYIVTYCGLSALQLTPTKQRGKMLQVAALAVAACEAFDRNNGFPPRHYDKEKLA